MPKVFLLTGFQNWGKTTLIKGLFQRKKFSPGTLYRLPGSQYDFCVLTRSNDDPGKIGYENQYSKVNEALKKNGKNIKKVDYIFSAFCPTREHSNRSDDIIRTLFAGHDIVIIPIEYKWCEHARLQLPEITQFYANIVNLNIIPLLGTGSTSQKLQQLNTIVQANLP